MIIHGGDAGGVVGDTWILTDATGPADPSLDTFKYTGAAPVTEENATAAYDKPSTTG